MVWYGGGRLAADLTLPKLRTRWTRRNSGRTDSTFYASVDGIRALGRAAVRRTACNAGTQEEFFRHLAESGTRIREHYSQQNPENPGEVTGYALTLPAACDQASTPHWLASSRPAADVTVPSSQGWQNTSTVPGEPLSTTERRAILEDAAAVVGWAAQQIRRTRDSAVTDDAAWATSDVLHITADLLKDQALWRAADAFDRAARMPYARIPRPTAVGTQLRRIARLMALAGSAPGGAGQAVVMLAVNLSRLVTALAQLREQQQRTFQATAAHVAARHLHTVAAGSQRPASVPARSAVLDFPSRPVVAQPTGIRRTERSVRKGPGPAAPGVRHGRGAVEHRPKVGLISGKSMGSAVRPRDHQKMIGDGLFPTGDRLRMSDCSLRRRGAVVARWAGLAALVTVLLGPVGAKAVWASDPRCPPKLKGPAGDAFDERRLCENVHRELGEWLTSGRTPDWGRVLRDSRKEPGKPAPKPKSTTTAKPDKRRSERRPVQQRHRPSDHDAPEETLHKPTRQEPSNRTRAPHKPPEEEARTEPRRRQAARPRNPAEKPEMEKPGGEEEGFLPTPSSPPMPVPQQGPAVPHANAPVDQGTWGVPAALGGAMAVLLAGTYLMRRRIAFSVGGALREWRAERKERRLAVADTHPDEQPTDEFPVPVPRAKPELEPTQEPRPVLEPAEIAAGSAVAYAISLAALRGTGLVGPGAEGVARAILVELLTGIDFPAEVVMPHGLARRLLGDAVTAKHPALVVLDSVRDVVTHVEVEIVRRTGEREGLGGHKDLPWLFVMAAPGEAAEALDRAITAGAESLVLGVMVDRWPYGITCAVDTDGTITHLEGKDAPPWVGHRIPTLTLNQAMSTLFP